MDLQTLLDGMSAGMKSTRSQYHLTLGQAIDKLSDLPKDTPVTLNGEKYSLTSPDSYRGYYEDLALVATNKENLTSGEVLETLKTALGKTFHGYKGGDFIMEEDTPLWVAQYGDCGDAIIDVQIDGSFANFITKKTD